MLIPQSASLSVIALLSLTAGVHSGAEVFEELPLKQSDGRTNGLTDLISQ